MSSEENEVAGEQSLAAGLLQVRELVVEAAVLIEEAPDLAPAHTELQTVIRRIDVELKRVTS